MTIQISRPAITPPTPIGTAPGGIKDTQQARSNAAPERTPPAGADPRPAELASEPTVRTLGGSTSPRLTEVEPLSVGEASGGVQLRQATGAPKPRTDSPAGSTPHPTVTVSTPIGVTSDGAQLTRDQAASDDQSGNVTGDQLASGRGCGDTRGVSVAGAQQVDRQACPGTQTTGAVGSTSRPDPAAIEVPSPERGSLLDPALALAADVLDDIERVRTANENRLRQLTRSVEDSDGEMRGFGLDADHPDVLRLGGMVAAMLCKSTVVKELGFIRPPKERGKPCCLECDAIKNLERKMRAHPLGAWAKAQRGVGDKQIARLLAAIGDPYWRPEIAKDDGSVTPEGPRTVSALWAYCGLHVVPGRTGIGAHEVYAGEVSGPGLVSSDALTGTAGAAPKRRRGERANWSTKAKTKAYLIATSCLKQLDSHCRAGHPGNADQAHPAGPAVRHLDECACSPYRVAYDERRAHTAVTRPDWTDGHSHNDALRVASKAILRDLWREAKRLHEHSASHATFDSHNRRAGGAKP